MKWIYGKQDIKTLERGQENCYLLTNGLGGFSSLTMIGSAARNDHALLMGCTQGAEPPLQSDSPSAGSVGDEKREESAFFSGV